MRQIIKILFSIALILSVTTCSKAGPFVSCENQQEEWVVIVNDVTATVYNACKEQCNADYLHTASMYKIQVEKIPEQKILAMERTMMEEYGITYGMVVKIEGTQLFDGVWQVQDTMNRRFKGQHKIDLLMPRHIRHGKWNNVRIYIPSNEYTKNLYTEKFKSI